MRTLHIETVVAVYSSSNLGGSLLCALYENGLKVCGGKVVLRELPSCGLLSRNICKELPPPRRAQFSSTWGRKPDITQVTL